MAEQLSLSELPEAFEIGRQRVTAPVWEALMPCQIIMTSPETGATGPTKIEAGEVFCTEAIPCHQWAPLNRAAGERFAAWIDSLPQKGDSFTQEELTEAAFAMRPREGEPELPHHQWWPAVLKYAAVMRDKKRGNRLQVPRPATPLRPGQQMPVMPFQTSGTGQVEFGRAPAEQRSAPVPRNAGRRVAGERPRTETPMPGTAPTPSPASVAG